MSDVHGHTSIRNQLQLKGSTPYRWPASIVLKQCQAMPSCFEEPLPASHPVLLSALDPWCPLVVPAASGCPITGICTDMLPSKAKLDSETHLCCACFLPSGFATCAVCDTKLGPGPVILGAFQTLNSTHPGFEVLCVLLCLPQHGWRLVLETGGRFHRLHALLKRWRHISTTRQGL